MESNVKWNVERAILSRPWENCKDCGADVALATMRRLNVEKIHLETALRSKKKTETNER